MTAHRDGDGDWRMRPARPSEGGGEDVRIVQRLATGQTLITPGRFIPAAECERNADYCQRLWERGWVVAEQRRRKETT